MTNLPSTVFSLREIAGQSNRTIYLFFELYELLYIIIDKNPFPATMDLAGKIK